MTIHVERMLAPHLHSDRPGAFGFTEMRVYYCVNRLSIKASHLVVDDFGYLRWLQTRPLIGRLACHCRFISLSKGDHPLVPDFAAETRSQC